MVCMAPAAVREQGSPPAVLSEPPQLFVEEGFPKERERERERERGRNLRCKQSKTIFSGVAENART